MLQEIYNHRFVIVEKIKGVGPKDPGAYDIAVRYQDGTTFVVEATSDQEDALNVASELAAAFDSWSDRTVIRSGPQPEPPMHGASWPGAREPEPTVAPLLREALLASAEILWDSVNERCPYDEIIDHVTDLLRGFLAEEVVDEVIEWADVNQCPLGEAITAWFNRSDAEVVR
jgi:hypothetical protein